jgi:hypothetical protein
LLFSLPNKFIIIPLCIWLMGGMYFDTDAQVVAPLQSSRSFVFYPDSLPQQLLELPVPETVVFTAFDNNSIVLNSYFGIGQKEIVQLRPLPDSLVNRKVKLSYRIFSGLAGSPYRLLDTSIIMEKWDPTLSERMLSMSSSPLISSPNTINYRGAFTRGVSLGNTQSLTLNSAFNLQLTGELGDDIKIAGALSDNSIPIQPEGNSQQLQEFDKVYIVLSNKNNSLTVGDFEIQKPPGYFLNYFKKLQGVQATNTSTLKKGKLTTSGGLAITKGKFNRYTLNVTEGNQGPYRLPGAEGETFVVILAGTERVYIDGIIRTRGFDRDYIIDYNSGELTFMPSVIVTKDSRIVVEYEYSNQQYLRSFANLNVHYKLPQWDFQINAFNEQDGKNSTRGRELSEDDKVVLAESGDSISSKLVNSIREIEPSNTSYIVSYSLKDTVINLKQFAFLSFPWREGSKRYVADFKDVGQGNGHYIRSNEGINGRIYRFVGEDANGRPLGQYQPLTSLAAPIRKQMFTAGAGFTPDSNTVITVEAAVSGSDNNLFSNRDDGDNYGLGLYLNAIKKNMVFSKKRKWKADIGGIYEKVDFRFKPITPYRSQEFNRDWNLSGLQNKSQQYVKMFLNQRIGSKFKFNYALSGLFQPDNFKALKHETLLDFQTKKTGFKAEISNLNTQNSIEKATFFRPNFIISQAMPRMGGLTLMATYQAELNQRESIAADTLLATSYAFQVIKLAAKNEFSKNFISELYIQRRNDYMPYTTDFQLVNHATDYGAKIGIKGKGQSALNITTTIRTFEIDRQNSSLKLTAKNTYLGQMDYIFSTIKNRLTGNTLFEVSSGREQKTEFNYIAVQPGTGQYVWIDFNGDSIQQVNEFTTEGFPEMRNFTRINILSNQFVPTLNTSFNQSLRWQGKSGGKNSFQVFLNKISSQSSFRFERKIKENTAKGFWNPFYSDVPDSSLVTFNQNFRHTFFFKRGDPIFELQWTVNTNNARNILVTGYERRRNDVFGFMGRYNIGIPFMLMLNLNRAYKYSDSESAAFKLNNFSIRIGEIKPEFLWIIDGDYRLSVSYQYLLQQNRIAPHFERSKSNDLGMKFDFNRDAKSSLRIAATMSLIKYDGIRNSAVEFAMLEGLKNGRNYLWSINYDLTLKNNVQLNFGYDGRKSEGADAVHTGRASVKAYF